jgi:sporulation protein YlmC with PRC-barrel domain
MTVTRLISRAGIIPISKLIGATVVDYEGEHLGQLVDFILDVGENQVSVAVILLSQDREAPERPVPVPMVALGYDAKERTCQLNVDRKTLERAPSFRPGEGPDTADRMWVAELYSYFGYLPYWL